MLRIGREGMDSPEAGTRLFKYRALGADLKYAIDILQNHRLYVSTPRQLNDPFECEARLAFEATDEQKLERAIRRIQAEQPSVSTAVARAMAPARLRMVEELGPKEIKSLIDTQLGFVSFAVSRSNLLMWAHYASAHRGIVLEFDATKLSDRNLERSIDLFGTAQRVRYSDSLPTISFYTDTPIDQAEKLLLTKSTHWEYEKERRIVVMDRPKQPYFEFPPELLTAIYLGCRINDDDRKAILKCLAERTPSVPIFRAIPSESKYEPDFFEMPR